MLSFISLFGIFEGKWFNLQSFSLQVWEESAVLVETLQGIYCSAEAAQEVWERKETSWAAQALQLQKERWSYSLTEFLCSGNIPAAHWESVKQSISSIASHSFGVISEPLSWLWHWADSRYPSPGSLRPLSCLQRGSAPLKSANSPLVCTCTPSWTQPQAVMTCWRYSCRDWMNWKSLLLLQGKKTQWVKSAPLSGLLNI